MDYDDIAVVDYAKDSDPAPGSTALRTADSTVLPSPVTKTRSFSDGGSSTPSRGRLSPSPLMLGPGRQTCRDDSSIGSWSNDATGFGAAPVTPRRPPPSVQSRSTYLQPQPPNEPSQRQAQEPNEHPPQPPSTPVSANSGAYLLQQQLQQQQQHLFNQPTYMAKPTPLSPKLDPSQIYASPTNILPRRSRGLDFSRAATSLHHSTLADQSSPDSSPNPGGSSGTGSGYNAMNIPSRKLGDYGGATESSTSLWSMMGRTSEKVYPSSSLGSAVNIAACSDSSSSSDEDDFMDEDTEEPFITTPQVGKTTTTPGAVNGPQTTMPWMPGSPATNGLMSFTHRQRSRKQPKRKVRGPLGLGFSSISTSSAAAAAGVGANNNLSRSPPSGYLLGRDASQHTHSRRESISWAANQLHISGSESDDNLKAQMDGADTLGSQRGVIRRAVTRRGNLLPKTKGFARIRAALAEENAPAEADFRREAEVVRQVLENDMDPKDQRLPLPPPLRSANTTANSSPSLVDSLDDLADDVMAMDASTGLGLTPGFGKQPVDKFAGGNRLFWNRSGHPATGSLVPPARTATTTPPPPQLRSYSTSSMADDTSMDSPVATGSTGGGGASRSGSGSGAMMYPQGGMFPMTASSSGRDTPQPGQTTSSSGGGSSSQQPQQQQQPRSRQPHQQPQQLPVLPSAAEITRRINSKRRRDDDLDPVSFKRRAVSPGMSVHNSPIMQSPLQRDILPWGTGPLIGPASLTSSRPGSGGAAGSGGIGSVGLFEMGVSNTSNTSTSGGTGAGTGAGPARVGPNKGRVGFQAMADTNDSITRLSIE